MHPLFFYIIEAKLMDKFTGFTSRAIIKHFLS